MCRFETAITLIRPLITLKILDEFPDAVFLGVDVESLLGEGEVSSFETSIPVQQGIRFDPTVGSPSNFYRSFRTLFSLELMLNRHSVRGRSRR